MRNLCIALFFLFSLFISRLGYTQQVHVEVTNFMSTFDNSGINTNNYVYHIWVGDNLSACNTTTGNPGTWYGIWHGTMKSMVNVGNGSNLNPTPNFNVNLEAWEHDCNGLCDRNGCDQGDLQATDYGINYGSYAPSNVNGDTWHTREPNWNGKYNLRLRFKWYAPALILNPIVAPDNSINFCGADGFITLACKETIWNGWYQWEYNDGSGWRYIDRTPTPSCTFNIPEYNDSVRKLTFRVVPYINKVVCYPDENTVTSHKQIIYVYPRKPALASYSVVQPKCFGQGGAEINLNINGKLGYGVDEYRYSLTYYGRNVPLSNPYIYSNTHTIKESDLSPGEKLFGGSYVVTISNSYGGSNSCSNSFLITVGQPTPLNITTQALKAGTSNFNISCNGADDGRISVSTTGGTPQYKFAINGADRNDTTLLSYITNQQHLFTGLKPDLGYKISIIDAHGCSSFSNVAPLSEPAALSSTTSLNTYPGNYNINCNGSTDTSFVIVSGGVPPYNVTMDGTTKSINTNGGLASFSELYGNTSYSIQIRDANNCPLTKNTSLTQPSPIIINNFDITKCNGEGNGSVSLIASGGRPSAGRYTFNLIKEGTKQSDINASSVTFDDLGSSNYTVEIVDNNGCIKDTTFLMPFSAIAPDLKDTVICQGQYLSLDVEEPDYTYHWNSDKGFTSMSPSLLINVPATYHLTATNQYGCTADASFELAISDKVFTANFAMPSEGFEGDSMVISEISWPIPASLEWTIPTTFDIYETDGALQFVKLPSPGVYTVKLNAYLGECWDDIQKQITVFESTLDTSISLRLGYSGIKALNLFPNPNSGHFALNIELTDNMPIELDIHDIYRVEPLLSKKEEGKESYTFYFNLNLSPGTYSVSVRTSNDRKNFKFVVQ